MKKQLLRLEGTMTVFQYTHTNVLSYCTFLVTYSSVGKKANIYPPRVAKLRLIWDTECVQLPGEALVIIGNKCLAFRTCQVSEPVPGRLHRSSREVTQTEPVPETEAPDTGKREEQSDARGANLKETADLEEDEEVKVQDVQEVQEVQEVEAVEEAPKVEEDQEDREVQKTQEVEEVEEVEPTVEQKQEEAKLEVIDVVMDKDVEMPNQNEIEVAAAAGSGRGLWKPDTFEQDVDEMLKKRKLKMGTASAPLEIQTVKTVTAAKAPVAIVGLADPSVSDLTARPLDRPAARPSRQQEKHVEKHVQTEAEKKADEKVEKADEEMERAQGGLRHTVLVR